MNLFFFSSSRAATAPSDADAARDTLEPVVESPPEISDEELSISTQPTDSTPRPGLAQRTTGPSHHEGKGGHQHPDGTPGILLAGATGDYESIVNRQLATATSGVGGAALVNQGAWGYPSLSYDRSITPEIRDGAAHGQITFKTDDSGAPVVATTGTPHQGIEPAVTDASEWGLVAQAAATRRQAQAARAQAIGRWSAMGGQE